MDNKKQNISIRIGEKSFSMRINPAEEENYRQASKLVQDKYQSYKSKYADKLSKEDLLSMVVFDIAKKNIELNKQKGETQLFLEISDLVDTIEDYLKAQ